MTSVSLLVLAAQKLVLPASILVMTGSWRRLSVMILAFSPRSLALAGLVEQVEILAAELIEDDDVAQARRETIEQLLEEIDRVAARIHDVPVVERDAEFAGHLEHAGFIHPLHKRLVGLGREIDEDAFVGIVARGLDDRVEALVAVHDHGRGVARIEAQEQAVRAVGVEAEERQVVVDEVLRHDPRDHGLAHAAFFATDQMNVRHKIPC